jgi:5'(3')-deoxyribonucleotidase
MKIEKKRIGLDYDCILANTTEEVVNLYNFYTGENLQLEDITEWDFSKVVPDKYVKLIFDLFYNDRLWNSIKPLPESQYYTTYPENVKIKTDWLLKQYPYINEKNIIITHNKQIIGVDLMIDDYEKNLINGHFSKILLDYPWNRNINDKEFGIMRAYNWKEIYDYTHMLLPTD